MELAPRRLSFLDLPFDVRECVYKSLLDSDTAVPEDLPKCPHDSFARPSETPIISTIGMLMSNRQIHSELQATMKLYHKRGKSVYRLCVHKVDHLDIAVFWTRLTVPLQYLHTLQIDVHEVPVQPLASEIMRLIMNFWEHGPELEAPHKLKFWPLVDTVLVILHSNCDKDQTSQRAELDGINSVPTESMHDRIVRPLLESSVFERINLFLGYYIRRLQVKSEGQIFERMMDQGNSSTADEAT